MMLLHLLNGLEVHLDLLFMVLLKLEALYIWYSIYFDLSLFNI